MLVKEETYQSTALLHIDGVQSRRPSDLIMKAIDTAHSDVIAEMRTEGPSIAELYSHCTQQRFRPFVIEFGRNAEVYRDSANGGSVKFLAETDRCIDGEDGWIGKPVQCSVSYTSGSHCACGHDGG
jgi:hypothetical protein